MSTAGTAIVSGAVTTGRAVVTAVGLTPHFTVQLVAPTTLLQTKVGRADPELPKTGLMADGVAIAIFTAEAPVQALESELPVDATFDLTAQQYVVPLFKLEFIVYVQVYFVAARVQVEILIDLVTKF